LLPTKHLTSTSRRSAWNGARVMIAALKSSSKTSSQRLTWSIR